MFVILPEGLRVEKQLEKDQPCVCSNSRVLVQSSCDTSPHVLASFSSKSESAAVHRSLKISVPSLRLLQKLDQVSRLQRDVPGFTGVVGQLHLEAAAVNIIVSFVV